MTLIQQTGGPLMGESRSEQTITIVVEPYGGSVGRYQAGIAIVRLNGKVIAQLRTSEGIEFVIATPEISTRKPS